MALSLTIITPERIVLDKQVDHLTARSTEGEFQVLPGHEPLVATLAVDVLLYDYNGEAHSAAVMGGVIEVRNAENSKEGEKAAENKPVTQVVVLSDVAELDTEIDETRARQAMERAEAEKTQRVDKIDVYYCEMAISRAVARLKAAELRARRRKPGGG